MKTILTRFFYHELIQYTLGRMYFKGTFYYYKTGLPMNCFWSEDERIVSCQAEILLTEKY